MNRIQLLIIKMINCVCSCGTIVIVLDSIPNEIAVCHCSICQKIHRQNFTKFTKFAKFHIKNIKIIVNDTKQSIYHILYIGSNDFIKIKSSARATRLSCIKCNDILMMYYYHSENIWIVADRLDININNIDHYDIYKINLINIIN